MDPVHGNLSLVHEVEVLGADRSLERRRAEPRKAVRACGGSCGPLSYLPSSKADSVLKEPATQNKA